MSLTNLVQAQVHFRKEKKANIERTSDEKLELLAKLENCSKTEAKQVIADEAETLFRVSGVQFPLSRNEEMPFRPCERLKAKLKCLREVKPNASLEDLAEQMTDLALRTWDPAEKAKRAFSRKEKRERSPSDVQLPTAGVSVSTADAHSQALDKTESENSIPEPKRRVEIPRTIKMQTQHEVQLRDEQACVNCGAKKNLELDHIKEFARGGSHDVENVRLLCRSCNQRHAIESYGLEKMSSYLR